VSSDYYDDAVAIPKQPVPGLHLHVCDRHGNTNLTESLWLPCIGHDELAEGRKLQGGNVIAVPNGTVNDHASQTPLDR